MIGWLSFEEYLEDNSRALLSGKERIEQLLIDELHAGERRADGTAGST